MPTPVTDNEVLVSITGGRKNDRQVLTEAIHFFITKLLAEKNIAGKKIFVSIDIIKGLYKVHKVKADVVSDSDWDFVGTAVYEIRLDASLKLYPKLKCLAHECVHIVQYFTGEMKDITTLMTSWKSKIVKHALVDYWEQPWELEAFSREIGLVEHFVDKYNYRNTAWYKRDPDFL